MAVAIGGNGKSGGGGRGDGMNRGMYMPQGPPGGGFLMMKSDMARGAVTPNRLLVPWNQHDSAS
jgi:hypothetical protein